LENVNLFYGQLEYLTEIWEILRPFGTFFRFCYHVPGKIWQPCFGGSAIKWLSQGKFVRKGKDETRGAPSFVRIPLHSDKRLLSELRFIRTNFGCFEMANSLLSYIGNLISHDPIYVLSKCVSH
jgi:hypothetical protein